jgi:hypothetical protein
MGTPRTRIVRPTSSDASETDPILIHTTTVRPLAATSRRRRACRICAARIVPWISTRLPS